MHALNIGLQQEKTINCINLKTGAGVIIRRIFIILESASITRNRKQLECKEQKRAKKSAFVARSFINK